jgi:poly(3-hydroxyalkanoate) depolymerase
VATAETRTIDVDGQRIGVAIKRGDGVPLLIFNDLGANLKLLDPLTRALEGIETIVFDVPGIGGSKVRRLPYRLRGLTRLAVGTLDKLGYAAEVDVLGVSWGGSLAQQFARSYPLRCLRLVLAATTPGILMVPGSPRVLAKLLAPRRYKDPAYLNKIAPQLYGGQIRMTPDLVWDYTAQLKTPIGSAISTSRWPLGAGRVCYGCRYYVSRPWYSPAVTIPLPRLSNSRILAWLIPKARLHVVEDGHLFLMVGSLAAAPVLRTFLLSPGA